jgi:propionyl-CoA carboxylase alpha chain
MNTRLQVEHPVTELITGVDLVEQMMRSAAGEPLAFGQEDLAVDGWAIESRLYAEDPYRNFMPSIGRLVRYRAPAEGERGAARVRNDTGVREGDEISMFYDPMIAKLAVWGPDRAAAVAGMAGALEELEIEGLGHNAPFLSAVMSQARFASGELSTNYIAEEFPGGFHGLPPSPWQMDAMAGAAAWMQRVASARARAGRVDPAARRDWIVLVAGERRAVDVDVDVDTAYEGLILTFAEGPRLARLEAIDWRAGAPLFKGRLDGRPFAATVAPAAEGFDIRIGAARARVLVLSPASAELHERLPPRPPADTSRQVLSPMPGLVISCEVAAGQAVEEGQVLFVVEAMKMQNIIRAERAGTLVEVTVAAGDSVAADDVLARFD